MIYIKTEINPFTWKTLKTVDIITKVRKKKQLSYKDIKPQPYFRQPILGYTENSSIYAQYKYICTSFLSYWIKNIFHMMHLTLEPMNMFF